MQDWRSNSTSHVLTFIKVLKVNAVLYLYTNIMWCPVWFCITQNWWNKCFWGHKQQPVKVQGSPYLCWHVEHHGYNRRLVVAVDDEAHLSKPLAEIDCVLRQLSHTVTSWRGKSILADRNVIIAWWWNKQEFFWLDDINRHHFEIL